MGVGYVMLENTDLNIYNGASAVWHAALFVSLKAIFCLKKCLTVITFVLSTSFIQFNVKIMSALSLLEYILLENAAPVYCTIWPLLHGTLHV